MATADVSTGAGVRTRSVTYLALFMVTLSALMYETVLTRIFSVTMWYHFAFVAISVALFGTTVGALIVHFKPAWFSDDRVKDQMWRFSLLFGVSIAFCFLSQLSIPFSPHATAAAAWSVVLTCLLISIPFTLAGVVVCLALTRFPGRVNRLYAADLIGAGLGCVMIVVLFRWFDGPSLVIFVGALGCVGGLLFAIDAGNRRGQVLAVVAAGLLTVLSVGNAISASHQDPFLRIAWAKEQPDPKHRYELWNAFSRVTADGSLDALGPPSANGLSPKAPPQQIRQMSILIDSTAGTAAIGRGDHSFLKYDVSNLAYHARPHGEAAVVGVGGGRDVLSALEFGAKHVTGIEINHNILHLVNGTLGDFTGHIDRNPRVRFVNDEARSWLTRSNDRFDVLQISMIDTWAATQAGAFALSENSLYTTNAWNTFLDRLKPGGILTVSRWYSLFGSEPLETFRTASLASQALTNRGVKDPRSHILIFKGPVIGVVDVATIMVSPKPFSAKDLATITGTAARLGFTAVLTPSSAVDHRFADLVRPGGPKSALSEFDADVSPPTDDRPFFFQMVKFNQLLKGQGFHSDSNIFRAVWVLTLLAITVIGLAAVCIAFPLLVSWRRARGRGTRIPPGMRPFYVLFAAIGLGFLLVEISQLQRLGVFLGHPTYALTVVLFTVLVFSGIGSLLTDRFVRPDRPATVIGPFVGLLALLAAFGFVAPAITHSMASATTPVRIALAVALLAPVALGMGMPFSIGMALASRTPNAPVAYLWGLNGAMSVVASVLGATIALFFGITAAYLSGVAAYAVAAAAIVVAALRPPATDPEADAPEPRAADHPKVLVDVR